MKNKVYIIINGKFMTRFAGKYDSFLRELEPNSYNISFDVQLKKHNSWKIGGPADILIEPFNKNCIKQSYRSAKQNGHPIIVIGRGSNVLFDDDGFRGIVIKLGKKFSSHKIEDKKITADAGIFVPKLAFDAAKSILTGLEHTCGIPGTLGGLVCMNGGSMNKSIGQNVVWVETVDPKGNFSVFSQDDSGFSYRKSVFQINNHIITRIKLNFEKGNGLDIRKSMQTILKNRKNNFPLNYPNCGSVFKINQELKEKFGPPGKIIDDAGLKGFSIGDAEISTKHANFIINKGKATSSDVIRVIEKAREHVYSVTNRYLKCEVQYVKPGGEMVPLDHVFL